MALYIPEPKLLFVHIPKTGGMSIRHGLMANEILGYGKSCVEIGKVHNAISDIVAEKGIEFVKSKLSFAVVRNPYSWAVSLYEFIKTSSEHPDHHIVKDFTFDQFVEFLCEAVFIGRETDVGRYSTQSKMICDDNGKKLVNCILRFEHLEDDWRVICLFINEKIKIRHINNHTYEKSYQDYYTHCTKEMINNTFNSDFINFNYTFL